MNTFVAVVDCPFNMSALRRSCWHISDKRWSQPPAGKMVRTQCRQEVQAQNWTRVGDRWLIESRMQVCSWCLTAFAESESLQS